ncbi:EPIDERMAL PATTERNING FACTOR-like protein 4 [Prosopis cineraria]|uniref:EPIDERMAL PATTERNING FACTOR-like protein 4 n=1 Tax=Prosopis cineraria TaxID=364024 RepID=UPI0024102401|nr:EPIDERMAL PATTERNING FACTOR-like protein 4 [Prosopis cineraria]XP_054818432.1 EPIDERMAL PATTERNING FACTOR-like protein 4 [Prosopis cineraria]
MERKKKINLRLIIINKVHLSFSFSFSSVVFIFLCCIVLLSTTCLDTSRFSPSVAKADGDFQKCVERDGESGAEEGDIGWGRRILGGPGSAPPRCASKCGSCTPCRPVHVTVPPGTPVTAEYYPEAWRCKCGNKLYMPPELIFCGQRLVFIFGVAFNYELLL